MPAVPMASPPLDRHARLQKTKRIVVASYIVLLLFSDVIYLFMNEAAADRVSPLAGLAISLFIFVWCKADADQHGLKIPRSATLIVILTSIFGLACYLVMIRKMPMGLGLTVWFFFTLLSVAVATLGASILFLISEYLLK